VEKPCTFATRKPAIFWRHISPCGGAAPYVTRHGFGYSVFEHMADGISSELTTFVALDAAVKFSSMKVSNHSGAPTTVRDGLRRVGAGDLRAKSAMHVRPKSMPGMVPMYARNRITANSRTGRLLRRR